MIQSKLLSFWLIACITVIFIMSAIAQKPKMSEADYQEICANLLKGKKEVVLSDKTRIDILTDDQAIEVDWSYKWAEGIGQALYYSSQTKRHAGLILICKDMERDQKYIDRVKAVILIKSLKIYLYVFDAKKKELRLLEK